MYSRGCRSCGEKGAITVFLALIFMSLIVFAGVVIDIVRITAAERKVQSALNASARSVLAGYDTELMGGYGIYGVNMAADGVKEDFYRYLIVNLRERHEGISFLKISVDRNDVEIQGMDSLLSDAAFKRQVQEYMKYRMPINVSQDLVEQLQNIKLNKKLEFARSEKATRDKARELRTKAEDVNAKLEGVKRKMADITADKLEEVSKELPEILLMCGTVYDGNGEGLLEDYNESKDDTNVKADEGECIGNQSEEFSDIKGNSENLAPELQEYMAEVNNTLSKIRPLVEDAKELEDRLAELQEELSDIEGEEDSQGNEGGIAEEADRVRDEMDAVQEELEQLEAEIDEAISVLKDSLERFSLDGYRLREEAVQLTDKKTEELKGFINQKKEEIAKALLARLEQDWLISTEEFNGSNVNPGEDFVDMDEMADYSSSISEDKAEESNDIILMSLERLAKAVDDIASSSAEKVSTIEYIMDKYTFLTSRTERDHFFRKGEVEYIISGPGTGEAYDPVRNTEYYIVTKVLLQVWALRFAIDTIDDFVRSVIVFPPQRLAFALAEGALDSSLDMFNMLNGEAVPICPKSFTAVRLKYSDHLKILLLMKPEEEILRKARQLMQVNVKNLVDSRTGLPRRDFRMGDFGTVVSASVTARVNLFFLPMLKVDRLMPGSFEGGSYKIRKQIHVGY